MNTARIEIDRTQAATLYRQYKEHRSQFTKTDVEIERIYRQIARGSKVIMAFESIRQTGLDAQGRPRLAIIRADAQQCYFSAGPDRVFFSMDRFTVRYNSKRRIEVPWPGMAWKPNGGLARIPLIPVFHRPAASLERYHILWEADWVGVPVDPMLLRRVGRDAWLVMAAWDLTAVERAVLA